METGPANEREIARAAADWWTRLREPAPSAETLAGWQAWMTADERHARAFDQLNALGEWLRVAQTLVLDRHPAEALALLEAGHAAHPRDSELALALAGLYFDVQRHADAEVLLNGILAAQPAHLGAAFALARVLRRLYVIEHPPSLRRGG